MGWYILQKQLLENKRILYFQEKESEPTTVGVGSSVGRQFPTLSRNPEDLNTAANCDFKVIEFKAFDHDTIYFSY